ncbi:MAG: alanine racemase [Burkholderiales bacterium]
MTRPLQARIHLSALKNNLAVVRRHAPQSRVMAVIKANAYGHGLLRVARALDSAEAFAVLELEKAIQLRDAGFRQTIIMLEGFFNAGELPLFAEHGLTTVVHSAEQIDMLAKTPLPVRLDVHLKINTGMNRLGFAPQHYHAALESLTRLNNVGKITLMTHFACADETTGIAAQMQEFRSLVGHTALPRSLANSAAILRYPESQADWVRPGIMLYGSSPFADKSFDEFALQPAMTFESEIISMQRLMPGASVGYGATFKTQQEKWIGTVACGYADGYPRHAPTGTPALVNGKLTRLLGRVSMDMLAVDLTGIANAGIGSKVVLWGQGLPVDEVARAAGTISYELLCAVAGRVNIVEEI